MGTTLENGVYLPSEGERNCYAGLKTNWEILDQKVADVTALQQAVAGALHREIVESLPTTDIDPNTIYMILSGTSATENVYNEFMYVNNAWELIGTSATDLTNYYTKAEVDGKLLLKASASDLTSHTGDTTIHVTASDKTKWTNSANTVVLRLAKTALTPSSSTNAFSNLDDSTALKVGDKVMDTAGVLFEVTAIDTQNSTFTIGTALIDLAQDSDVVHKSGNETISGDKVFNTRLIKNIDVVLGTAPSTGKFSNIDIADNNKASLLQILGGVYDTGNSYARLFIQNKMADDGTGLSPTGTLRTCGFNINLPATSTSEGQGSITPRGNKTTDFGLVSYQWRNVWCEKLFLNGTQLDPSAFVTTDTAQTISGNKTFSSNVNVYNSDSSTDTANIVLKNSKAERGSTTNIGEQNIFFLDKDSAQIGQIKCEVDSSGTSTLTLQCTNSSNGSAGIRLRRTSTGTFLQPVYNNGCNLGTTGSRWYDVQTKAINGLVPSSLSLPDLSNGIDISSYITHLDKVVNNYTPPANGWLSIRVKKTSLVHASLMIYQTGGLLSSCETDEFNISGTNLPVIANKNVEIYIYADSLASAIFYPCQGNV